MENYTQFTYFSPSYFQESYVDQPYQSIFNLKFLNDPFFSTEEFQHWQILIERFHENLFYKRYDDQLIEEILFKVNSLHNYHLVFRWIFAVWFSTEDLGLSTLPFKKCLLETLGDTRLGQTKKKNVIKLIVSIPPKVPDDFSKYINWLVHEIKNNPQSNNRFVNEKRYWLFQILHHTLQQNPPINLEEVNNLCSHLVWLIKYLSKDNDLNEFISIVNTLLQCYPNSLNQKGFYDILTVIIQSFLHLFINQSDNLTKCFTLFQSLGQFWSLNPDFTLEVVNFIISNIKLSEFQLPSSAYIMDHNLQFRNLILTCLANLKLLHCIYCGLLDDYGNQNKNPSHLLNRGQFYYLNSQIIKCLENIQPHIHFLGDKSIWYRVVNPWLISISNFPDCFKPSTFSIQLNIIKLLVNQLSVSDKTDVNTQEFKRCFKNINSVLKNWKGKMCPSLLTYLLSVDNPLLKLRYWTSNNDWIWGNLTALSQLIINDFQSPSSSSNHLDQSVNHSTINGLNPKAIEFNPNQIKFSDRTKGLDLTLAVTIDGIFNDLVQHFQFYLFTLYKIHREDGETIRHRDQASSNKMLFWEQSWDKLDPNIFKKDGFTSKFKNSLSSLKRMSEDYCSQKSSFTLSGDAEQAYKTICSSYSTKYDRLTYLCQYLLFNLGLLNTITSSFPKFETKVSLINLGILNNLFYLFVCGHELKSTHNIELVSNIFTFFEIQLIDDSGVASKYSYPNPHYSLHFFKNLDFKFWNLINEILTHFIQSLKGSYSSIWKQSRFLLTLIRYLSNQIEIHSDELLAAERETMVRLLVEVVDVQKTMTVPSAQKPTIILFEKFCNYYPDAIKFIFNETQFNIEHFVYSFDFEISQFTISTLMNLPTHHLAIKTVDFELLKYLRSNLSPGCIADNEFIDIWTQLAFDSKSPRTQSINFQSWKSKWIQKSININNQQFDKWRNQRKLSKWMSSELAKYCISNKLRTPLGSPEITLQHLENALELPLHPFAQRVLLEWMDEMEMGVVASLDGFLSTDYFRPSPKGSVSFFRNNRLAFERWLLRSRSRRLILAAKLNDHYHVIQLGRKWLNDYILQIKPDRFTSKILYPLLVLCQSLFEMKEISQVESIHNFVSKLLELYHPDDAHFQLTKDTLNWLLELNRHLVHANPSELQARVLEFMTQHSNDPLGPYVINLILTYSDPLLSSQDSNDTEKSIGVRWFNNLFKISSKRISKSNGSRENQPITEPNNVTQLVKHLNIKGHLDSKDIESRSMMKDLATMSDFSQASKILKTKSDDKKASVLPYSISTIASMSLCNANKNDRTDLFKFITSKFHTDPSKLIDPPICQNLYWVNLLKQSDDQVLKTISDLDSNRLPPLDEMLPYTGVRTMVHIWSRLKQIPLKTNNSNSNYLSDNFLLHHLTQIKDFICQSQAAQSLTHPIISELSSGSISHEAKYLSSSILLNSLDGEKFEQTTIKGMSLLKEIFDESVKNNLETSHSSHQTSIIDVILFKSTILMLKYDKLLHLAPLNLTQEWEHCLKTIQPLDIQFEDDDSIINQFRARATMFLQSSMFPKDQVFLGQYLESLQTSFINQVRLSPYDTLTSIISKDKLDIIATQLKSVNKLGDFLWEQLYNFNGEAASANVEVTEVISVIKDHLVLWANQELSVHIRRLSFTTSATDTPESMCALRILDLLYKYGKRLDTKLVDQIFSDMPTRVWSSIVPQLVSGLYHSDGSVINTVKQVLINLVAKGSNNTLYQLMARAKSSSPLIQETIDKAISQSDNFSRIHATWSRIVDELEGLTTLWDEQWLHFFQKMQPQVQNHFTWCHQQLDWIDQNLSLIIPPSQNQRTKLESIRMQSYKLFVSDIIKKLRQLIRDTFDQADQHNLNYYNILFKEKFHARIIQALKDLDQPDELRYFKNLWLPFEGIYKELAATLGVQRTIPLRSISSWLAELKENTVTLPHLDRSPPIKLVGFSASLTILPTKTKPKKLSLIGEDGIEYPFLFKGMDDLRLDERIMQFFKVSNSLLKYQKSTKCSGYHMKTYGVVPLGPRIGMIEWVPNTIPLYSLLKQWRQRDSLHKLVTDQSSHPQGLIGVQQKVEPTTMIKGSSEHFWELIGRALEQFDLPSNHPRSKWPLELQLQVYKELSRSYPDDLITREVQVRSFSSKDWYHNTKKLIESLATSCMVGYAVGLGDRHLDNILFDINKMEFVHIDFNISFDRGKYLLIPERVPFRLTRIFQSLIGFNRNFDQDEFFNQCTQVFRGLKESRAHLVPLLTPFRFDPLVESRTDPNKLGASATTTIRLKWYRFTLITPSIKSQLDYLQGFVKLALNLVSKLEDRAESINSDTTLVQQEELEEFKKFSASIDRGITRLIEMLDIATIGLRKEMDFNDHYIQLAHFKQAVTNLKALEQCIDTRIAHWDDEKKIFTDGSILGEVELSKLAQVRKLLDDTMALIIESGGAFVLAVNRIHPFDEDGNTSVQSVISSKLTSLGTPSPLSTEKISYKIPSNYVNSIANQVNVKLGEEFKYNHPVENHVATLIREAVDEENLCCMFEGWTSWI